MKPKKFLIVGRSATGKTSITHAVCEMLRLTLVKSFTTRLPRNEEERLNSKDHYFVTDTEFDDIYYSQEVIAYTQIDNARYCATKEELDNCDFYVIDPRGIRELYQRCGDDYEFITIYIRVPKDVAKKRAIQRGQDVDEWLKRYLDEDGQFSAFEQEMAWDYHILNDGTLQESVEKLINIITKEKEIEYGEGNQT